jgi:hypothetical protein
MQNFYFYTFYFFQFYFLFFYFFGGLGPAQLTWAGLGPASPHWPKPVTRLGLCKWIKIHLHSAKWKLNKLTPEKKYCLPFCCTFCLLLSSLFLWFCEWLVPLILVFDRSPVLPPVFVCCFRLPKLWRNSAFPFLCFNPPLSSPGFFIVCLVRVCLLLQFLRVLLLVPSVSGLLFLCSSLLPVLVFLVGSFSSSPFPWFFGCLGLASLLLLLGSAPFFLLFSVFLFVCYASILGLNQSWV